MTFIFAYNYWEDTDRDIYMKRIHANSFHEAFKKFYDRFNFEDEDSETVEFATLKDLQRRFEMHWMGVECEVLP